MSAYLGDCATSIARPRFNPFTQGHDLFSTYCKWNGRNDLENAGLKLNAIYRVMSADIQSFYTELTLQEVSTGIILPRKYNSVAFTTMPSYIGCAYAKPQIGKRFDMVKVDPVNHKMLNWNTSPVQALEQVGTNTWNVITLNSVYTVQIING